MNLASVTTWRATPRVVGAVVLLGLIATGAARAADPLLSNTDELGSDACSKAKIAALANAPLPERPNAGRALNLTNTDVLHYDLDIEIIPTTQSIDGQNTMTVQSLVDGLTTFQIRLSDTFTINDITIGGNSVGWTRDDSIHVTVTLDHAYDTGEQFAMTVAYAGQASGGGFGSIIWSTSAGKPYVYTLSETWFAYTWWPNKDDNTDKATADLTFTIPDSVFLVSNGLLISDTPVAGSKRRLHYKTNYQTATYLFQFAMGDYHTFSGSHAYSGGVMPLEFALLSGSDSTANRNAWLKTQDILPVFDELFGLYPFIDEKYGIYQFGFGGGMEHQTMTGQGTTSESVTAHELAHQWWGDNVTCAQWNDIWLNEGFATYSEALWAEFKNGADDQNSLRMAMAARKPSSVNDTVYVYDTSNVNRIFSSTYSYNKGAWVLHMLRGVLGDEDFFATLAAYRATYQAGAATTLDFRDVAEAVSGLDLDTFFDQWVFEPGSPTYNYAYANYTINGQVYTEIYLYQSQTISYPVFEMPVRLRLTTGAGTVNTTVQDTVRTQHFLIPVGAATTGISVDPDQWILRGSGGPTTYIAGPPKLVQASPAPGDVLTSAPTQLTVAFHRDVVVSPSDVSLVGQAWGSIAIDLSYDAPSRTLTITPTQPMPADHYVLSLSDSITAGGASLDGEIMGATLPSGDGIPGGDAAIAFQYAPPIVCAGDIDGDNDTDVFDFSAFAQNFGLASGATRAQGDLDDNGTVDVLDFTVLSADFGCTP